MNLQQPFLPAGNHHALLGRAKRPTNAVLEMKGLMCDIQNLQVHSDYGDHYTAAIHWYTNQVNVNYVGFNRLRNIAVYSAKFGLLIGAPPSQQECCPWQGVTAPDGQATGTWVVMSFACRPVYF
jgi:hypothetical protein